MSNIHLLNRNWTERRWVWVKGLSYNVLRVSQRIRFVEYSSFPAIFCLLILRGGWFVGGLVVCWWVGLLVCWWVGLLVGWFVGLLLGRHAGRLRGRSPVLQASSMPIHQSTIPPVNHPTSQPSHQQTIPPTNHPTNKLKKRLDPVSESSRLADIMFPEGGWRRISDAPASHLGL